MALARDVQIGLLPDRPPWNGEEIAVYARSIPAYEVGGDFYSYLAMSEGRAAIAIGEKGAALLLEDRAGGAPVPSARREEETA